MDPPSSSKCRAIPNSIGIPGKLQVVILGFVMTAKTMLSIFGLGVGLIIVAAIAFIAVDRINNYEPEQFNPIEEKLGAP